MSTTEPFPTSLRNRKSVVVRKLDSELELLHADHRKTAKQRWAACLAFIFKRSKLKSDSHILCTSSSSSSLTTSETATLPSDHHHLHSNDHHGDIGNSISEKATYHYSVSLPPTPVSSLSPPPRHIMTRQNRTKSLTPMDQPYTTSPPSFSSTPILPISSHTSLPPPPPPPTSTKNVITTTLINAAPVPQQRRRRIIRRSSTLRLSLDVDQRYSYTSSLHSTTIDDNTHNHDHGEKPSLLDATIQHLENASSSSLDDSMIRQQQYPYWKNEESTSVTTTQKPPPPPFVLDFDEGFDDFYYFDDDDNDDDDESCNSRQIRKQKAHYEAVVTSTMYHHHRYQDDDDDERSQSPPSKMDPFLDTPPSSAAPLPISFPPLPCSPHSLASSDTHS